MSIRLSVSTGSSERTKNHRERLWIVCLATLIVFVMSRSSSSMICFIPSSAAAEQSSFISERRDHKTGNYPTANGLHSNEMVEVRYGDSIYTRGDWDGSPVVLPEYKLVFFTTAKVACTVWKQVFRRLAGLPDWDAEDYSSMIPWNPETNGLTYLYDFDRATATKIMTDPDWTRATFVRDPKERFVSAYLDKAVQNPTFITEKCCPYHQRDCGAQARNSSTDFFKVLSTCNNAHWNPQSHRMGPQYWPLINFVGHMETLQGDARRLLQKVGAWNQFGAESWNASSGAATLFGSTSGMGRKHATNARDHLLTYIDTIDLEFQLEDYYADDYRNQVLNLSLNRLYGNHSSNDTNRTGKED